MNSRGQDRCGIPGNIAKIPGDRSSVPGNGSMLVDRGWAAGRSRSMTVPNRFLPTRDGELTAWLDNFQAKIAADPAKYGLTGLESAAVTAACAAWSAAYLAANQPSTRTSIAIAAKAAQKRVTLAVVRPIAGRIRADTGIDDALERRARPARPRPAGHAHPPTPFLSLPRRRGRRPGPAEAAGQAIRRTPRAAPSPRAPLRCTFTAPSATRPSTTHHLPAPRRRHPLHHHQQL